MLEYAIYSESDSGKNAGVIKLNDKYLDALREGKKLEITGDMLPVFGSKSYLQSVSIEIKKGAAVNDR